jgi:hypothetical protein
MNKNYGIPHFWFFNNNEHFLVNKQKTGVNQYVVSNK